MTLIEIDSDIVLCDRIGRVLLTLVVKHRRRTSTRSTGA